MGTHGDPSGPSCTSLYPSVASSSDSLMSASHQADVPTADLDSTTTTDSLCGGGVVGCVGVIIESNLNRVRLSCCWVGVGLGCDNLPISSLFIDFLICSLNLVHPVATLEQAY